MSELIEIVELPNCPSTVNNRRLYEEKDSEGNVVEIWCNREYQMKVKLADGTTGWIGKCIFSDGVNLVVKKVDGTPIKNDDGQTVGFKDKELLKTSWTSFDPVEKPPTTGTVPGPTRTGDDKTWVYDKKSNKYFSQKTKHQGRWELVQSNGGWRWEWVIDLKTLRKHGEPTEPAAPPSDPVQLSMAGDPSAEENGEMVAITPKYIVYTPVPITDIVDGDKVETSVFRLPINSNHWEVERVEAVASEPFSFDIDMPGEDIGIVTYKLLEAPPGMTINPNTGLIQWTPKESAIGKHTIKIQIQWAGLTPDEDTFILLVRSQKEKVEQLFEFRPVIEGSIGFSDEYRKEEK